MSGEKSFQPELKPEFTADQEGYVNFGDVSRRLLNKQCQYGCRYLGGCEADGYPDLGQGLRVTGKQDDYHNLKIHKDDIEEFVRRYQELSK